MAKRRKITAKFKSESVERIAQLEQFVGMLMLALEIQKKH